MNKLDCFEQYEWDYWLEQATVVFGMNTTAGMPVPCVDCTAKFQKEMLAEDRCHPPPRYCSKGHELTPDNILGYNRCRTCKNEWERQSRSPKRRYSSV